MPPFPGIPYLHAPEWCFPTFELGIYVLFMLCLLHAIKEGKRDVMYLIGGLAFGVLLEYMEVSLGNYSYGKFIVMIGKAPKEVPLCIGVGWGIIMYSARLFTDRFNLNFWACAALDTLLALNIDLSMDIVAYRMHMWHWNWLGTGLNPLTAQWFGIPYGNFIGWTTVVFCFSCFSRIFEKKLLPATTAIGKYILTTIFALMCSLAVLYGSETYLFPFTDHYLNLWAGSRLSIILVVLILLITREWRNRKVSADKFLVIVWSVPVFFHVFFFSCLFILGFYTENKWLTIAACVNILIGVIIHIRLATLKSMENKQPKAL